MIRLRRCPPSTGAGPISEDNSSSWWRATRLLAIFALAIGGGLGLGTILLASAPDAGNVRGIANGVLAATFFVPVVILALIFFSAARQRRIDDRHGYFEE